MRYLIGFMLATALVASPLSAGAQDGEASTATPSAATEVSQETESSPSWLRRMHPGAVDAPAKESDAGFEIDYATAQSQPYSEEGRRKSMSRGGKIALGVLVPALAAGLAVGVWVGVSGTPFSEPIF